ncbi:MAG: glycosyl transferase [Lachnospiraceae bacterium]|nr:glycosyl transferase [Lachnospiraceae bacterium]
MNYGKKGVRLKQKALHSKSGKWGRKLALSCVKLFLIGGIALGIVGISAAIGIFKGVIAAAPVISSNDVAPVGEATYVYDNNGNQISKLVAQNANRTLVEMEQIPQDLADAFVAIEDQRFYEHNGVDVIGMLRAGFQFLKTGGEETQGASTITQQLLKNTIFTDWVSEDSMIEKIERKLQEQYLALELTKILSKEEILLRYMNTINLGQNTLGVQEASLRYFNKSVSDLTLSECAVIAGITQNPYKYNPILHPDKNAERRERVLNNMLEQEYISKEEYDIALADDVYSRIQTVNTQITSNSVNSYFVDALADEVYNDLIEAGYSATSASFLLYSGGLRIYSTMDPDIQAIADEEFADPENFPIKNRWYLQYALTIKTADGEYEHHSKEMLQTWFKQNVDKNFDLNFVSHEDGYAAIEQYKTAILEEGEEVFAENISFTVQPQMSMVIQDPQTGHVVAMIGGRGAKEGSRTLNRATSTLRSPGSTFKVLGAYAPALDTMGMTLATVINDAPFAYNDGTLVRNWWDKGTTQNYRGINSLRTGIKSSMNVLTVKLLTWITPQLGFDYIEEFGISTLSYERDCYQPLALGGVSGVTNLELNAAYSTIANGGIYMEPKLYTKVVDSEGNVILDNTETESHRALKETTAFLLTSAMEDVVTTGTGTAVNFRTMSIAGKTGTATDDRDLWFTGYTPYYSASVWTGYDDNSSLDTSNSNPENDLSKKLWRAVMERIHEDLPNQTFAIPNGIVQMQICSKSGMLPVEGLCDAHLRMEYFDENTVPTDYCNMHYAGTICAYSNLIACEDCPFKIQGSVELNLIEDPSLWPGSTIITENPDGTITTTTPKTDNYCPHNTAFYEQPDAYAILELQRRELEARGLYFSPYY